MCFNQAGSRGKNRRKGEEQAAKRWAVLVCDEASRDTDGAAKDESDDPLVQSDSLNGGEAHMDDHGLFGNPPKRQRGCEPDWHESCRGHECGWSVAAKHPTHSERVATERDGAEEHELRFGGGVRLPMCRDGNAESGERDGWRGTEEAGEGFRPQHLGDYGKDADDDSADEKTGEEFSWGHFIRSSGCTAGLLDHAFCGMGVSGAEKYVALALQPVIVDEEFFELVKELLGQVVKLFQVGVLVVHFGDGE